MSELCHSRWLHLSAPALAQGEQLVQGTCYTFDPLLSCGSMPAGWQDVPVPTVDLDAATASPPGSSEAILQFLPESLLTPVSTAPCSSQLPACEALADHLQHSTSPTAHSDTYGCCSYSRTSLASSSLTSDSSLEQQQQQQQHVDFQQQQLEQLQGQPSCEQPPPGYAASTVFFAGVSPIATTEALLSVFDQFGRVITINLFRPYKTCKTSKGCGLVVFSERTEAALAMDTLAGRFIWPGARTPIAIEWCNNPAQLQQAQQAQQQQQQQKRKKKRKQKRTATEAAATSYNRLVLPGMLQQLLVPQQHIQQQQQPVAVAGSVGLNLLLQPNTGGAPLLLLPSF